ncbi:MAG: nucleoside triphosphate pyrophosphohydrolase [Bacteroidales bacterium]|nr:nucleoside triphosphate pyrophosphohydrolase [Bacteroidales bacterium]
MNTQTLDAFTRLDTILRTLRIECPWDKVQTMQSLRYLTIEETYELSEAILSLACDDDSQKANNELKKELGDLFMHLMFYAMIAEEEQRFDLGDVLNAISDKLVDRHPFIYRKEEYHGEGWEQIKMHEGRKSVLEGVPASLPPLDKAVRMQEKAAGIGYKMPDCSDVAHHLSTSLKEDIDEEAFGDLLFNLIHWAHSHDINADDALSRANRKFQDSVKAFEKAETK